MLVEEDAMVMIRMKNIAFVVMMMFTAGIALVRLSNTFLVSIYDMFSYSIVSVLSPKGTLVVEFLIGFEELAGKLFIFKIDPLFSLACLLYSIF